MPQYLVFSENRSLRCFQPRWGIHPRRGAGNRTRTFDSMEIEVALAIAPGANPILPPEIKSAGASRGSNPHRRTGSTRSSSSLRTGRCVVCEARQRSESAKATKALYQLSYEAPKAPTGLEPATTPFIAEVALSCAPGRELTVDMKLSAPK